MATRMLLLELLMLLSGTLINILEMVLVLSLLHLLIEFTWQPHKLCIWRWVARLLVPLVLVKPKPQRIYLMVWLKPVMCSTAPVKWTINLWVIFIKVLPHQDVGDASISSIDFYHRSYLYALFSSRVLPMRLKKIRRDFCFKEIKFH